MLRQVETPPATTVAGTAPKTEAVVTPPKDESLRQPFTPQEIAQAVAELEAEQRGKQIGIDDATQLSDILAQLQVDLPAAKVAEQVQKARILRLQARKRRRRNLLLGALGSIVACLGVAAFFLRPSTRVETVTTAATAAVVEDAAPVSTATNKALPLDTLMVTDRSSGEAVEKTLAEVPEGSIVYLANSELQKVMGVPPGYITDGAMGAEDYWTVFRKGNTCYLRAYTTARRTRAALLATPAIQLYNISTTLHGYARYEPAVPVTLPLSAISLKVDNWFEARVSDGIFDVHIDEVDRVTFGK